MVPRRTEVKKTASRGEPVVKEVLAATLEEIGRVGYRALRIEDVAARANVHKTTVYRRWPTKQDLVRETMLATIEEQIPPPNTGSLRGDLLQVANQMVGFFTSVNGEALVRMMMTERAEDDLRKITDSLRSAKEAVPRQIVDQATLRGELREGVDFDMLMTTMVGSLHHSIFAMSRKPSKAGVEALVDLLLYGAAVRGP
jgi:AcrR family transcriptional regulator